MRKLVMKCDCCISCNHRYVDCVADSIENYYSKCLNCHKKVHLVGKEVEVG